MDVIKRNIPVLAAPLCLTLTATVGCSAKTPEDVAESFCMKFSECYAELYPEYDGGYFEQYQMYCTMQYESLFKEIEEKGGDDCWKATVRAFDCILDKPCSTLLGGDGFEDQCTKELEDAEAKCPNNSVTSTGTYSETEG